MAVTLTATARILIRYVVSGLNHVHHAYCTYTVVALVPLLVDRDGSTTMSWTGAIQNYWDNIRPMFTAASLPATASATLQQRSGLVWNPIASYALTGGGSHGGAVTLASELTMVVRDTQYKQIRVTWLETAFGYAGHSNNGRGIDAAMDTLAAVLDGGNGNPIDPYHWQKSRGDRYILASGAIAGATLDFNDRLKRDRGLA